MSNAIQAPGYIKTFEQFEAVLKRTRKHEAKAQRLRGSLEDIDRQAGKLAVAMQKTRLGSKARAKVLGDRSFNDAVRAHTARAIARHAAVAKGRNVQLAEYNAWYSANSQVAA